MKKALSLVFMLSLFCEISFAQSNDVMVVRQADGSEVEYDVANVEKVYIKTVDPTPEPDLGYVDLGLPSGVKWAKCNLGASKPEEYGDYYGWGCTAPYATGDNVNWTKYFEKIGSTGTGSSDCSTDKDPLKDYVYPNEISIAGTKWDAARQKLGGTWRMPTIEEQYELLNTDNCNWEWTTENGVNGYKVTSKHNGNSIFLPAAGYRAGTLLRCAGSDAIFWSSSPDDISVCARIMYFNGDLGWYFESRAIGCTVRPVLE